VGKKVLILSNHFITLYNFRKELIKQILEEGHKVIISIPKSDENKFFSDMGCQIIETAVDRRGINPLKDFQLIVRYIRIMKEVKPDIIFSYTIKPNVYGTIASNFTNYKQVSNVTGTGATFLKENMLSSIAKWLYKVSIKRSYKVFFQNSGDRDYFVENNMVQNNYSLLPGSGVNLEEYKLTELPNTKEINFIFIGRVMKLKGIDQYLEAAKTIKRYYPNTSFYVAGFIEEEEYKGIIDDYHNRGIINYIGFQKDIKSWIQNCHCTILPSHGGEGVPNVLLESAAMGRVCIASNINGSKDVIEDGRTGYLFEVSNSIDLSSKMKNIILMLPNEIKEMSLASRNKVEERFDRQIVINSYLKELK